MKILGLDRLAFAVRDLDAAISFYSGILGVACERETATAVLRFGDCELALRTPGAGGGAEAANSAALGSQNFCFRAQGDADCLLSYLTERGVRVVEPKVALRQGALGEMRSVYAFDPDFNLVEIGVYQASEQPFQVTALDHVVLVVKDFAASMKFYQNTLGMEGTAQDGHGVLRAGEQKFNVHDQKPRYAPHEPYAAMGSVECRLRFHEDERIAGMERQSYLRDPDGNLIELGKR